MNANSPVRELAEIPLLAASWTATARVKQYGGSDFGGEIVSGPITGSPSGGSLMTWRVKPASWALRTFTMYISPNDPG